MGKPRLAVKSSTTAAVSLKSGMEKAKGGFVNTALGVAVFAVAWLGLPGMIGSFFIDRAKNDRVANEQKKVLADYYRVPVAAQLGIDPNSVTVKDLQLAAQVNPMVANAIAKVDREKNSQNRVALMAAGGGIAGGALLGGAGLLPGISGLSHSAGHAVAHTVGSVGGSVAGMAVNPLFDKHVLETTDVAAHISEKRSQGQAVEANDIFLLRMAQDEQLQKQIKKQTGGHAFHKMNPAQQQVVMQSMPELMQAAARDAELLNRGQIDEANLVMHSPGMQQRAEQGGWAQRVGGQKMRAGSFAAQVNAERATGPQALSV